MARALITDRPNYRGYRIQNEQAGCREEILDAIIDSLEYMWNTCSKKLSVCHLMAKLQEESTQKANKYITGTLCSFRRTMQNRRIKTEYIWTREFGKAEDRYPHYHIAVILEGKHIQSAFTVAEHLNSLMSGRLNREFKGFHICKPQSDSYSWAKKVTKKLNNFPDAVHWLSYLAKIETKKLSRHQKSYGHSKGHQAWAKATIDTGRGLKTPFLPNEITIEEIIKDFL